MRKKNKSQKIGEKEDKEIKSIFDGSSKEWLKLIKTIVSMANTSGGIIILEKVNVNLSEMDPAKIDDKVNSYVSPRIHNIIVKKFKKQGVEINIPNSLLKPHIFKKDGSFLENNKQKFEFYIGQIWVRHSAKNEPITPDDFSRIIKENLDKFLERINVIAAQFPLKELEISKEGMPLKIKPIETKKEGIPAIKVKEKIDPNIEYPYQAKDLAKFLNRNRNYIVKLLQVLALKDDPEFSFSIKNSSGNIIMRKYNDKCVEKLRKFFSEKPKFNPWQDKL